MRAISIATPQQPLRLPDFRVVTRAGEQLLVEVKNVGPAGIVRPQKLRAADIAAQQRYAQLTGASLLLAHYWAAPNHWTLIDSRVLSARSGSGRAQSPSCWLGNW
jgi:hypothetical protein